MAQSSGYSKRDKNLVNEMTKVIDSYKPGAAYQKFEEIFGTWAEEKRDGSSPRSIPLNG